MNPRPGPVVAAKLVAPTLVVALTLVVASACREDDADRRTRAGEAIALETAYQARAVARRAGLAPDDACGTYEIAPSTHITTTWELTGSRDRDPVLGLGARREVVVDAAQQVAALHRLTFSSEHGRVGTREREWRIVDGDLFTREDNLPFERRPIDVSERPSVAGLASEVFETLVEAAGYRWAEPEASETGWRAVIREDDASGLRIRCGRGADPWLEAMVGSLRAVSGEIAVTYGAGGEVRVRRGRFRFERPGDGKETLDIEVREVIRPLELAEGSGEGTGEGAVALVPIVAPSEVADLSRDRLHRDLTRFLRALDEVSPPAAPAVRDTSPEGTGDGTIEETGEGTGEAVEAGAESPD